MGESPRGRRGPETDRGPGSRDSTSPGDPGGRADRDAPAPRSARTSPRATTAARRGALRSEEHTSELQSLAYLVCRLQLEKKKKIAMKLTKTSSKNILITSIDPFTSTLQLILQISTTSVTAPPPLL